MFEDIKVGDQVILRYTGGSRASLSLAAVIRVTAKHFETAFDIGARKWRWSKKSGKCLGPTFMSPYWRAQGIATPQDVERITQYEEKQKLVNRLAHSVNWGVYPLQTLRQIDALLAAEHQKVVSDRAEATREFGT